MGIGGMDGDEEDGLLKVNNVGTMGGSGSGSGQARYTQPHASRQPDTATLILRCQVDSTCL